MIDNKIINTTNERFEEDVIKNPLPVALYFHSAECLHCIAFSPLFEKLSDQYYQVMSFVKVELPRNRELAEKYNVRSVPTIVFLKDGVEICSKLSGYITASDFRTSLEVVNEGRCPRKPKEKVYCDVVILGAGPAGLSSAIYTARAKLFTVVVDEGLAGGQVATTYHVANYPGTNGVVRGLDLMENMKKQATDYGAVIDEMKEVFSVSVDNNKICVDTDGAEYRAKALIIATGATPRKLPAQGEEEYRARGVHYCATCDGAMYQDKDVIVVGGGNSAVEEAVFLTRYANKVTIIHQLDYFQASKSSAKEAIDHPKIDVIWDSEIRRVYGNDFVEGVTIENLITSKKTDINTDAVFAYIGLEPKSYLFKNLIEMDDWGYVITSEDMKTSISGIYAVGDVRQKRVRQIATASADGVIAGIMVEKSINEVHISSENEV